MKKSLIIIVVFLALLNSSISIAQNKKLAEYIPEGFRIVDTVRGDLNKDNLEDAVIIIKKTDRNNVVMDEVRGELDRNRRGILVLFSKEEGYEQVVKNPDCFSSENEDGGVYFPPEMSVNIVNGNFYIHYSHGRYGYWKYTFRYQKSDFVLIGYDSSENMGPVTHRETSINFLTKKKITRQNTFETAEGEDEVFKENLEDIKIKELIKLSEIEDFDTLSREFQK